MDVSTAQGLDIRTVTEEQTAAYQRDGWVKVPGLISPAAARQLLEGARGYEAGREIPPGGSARRDLAMFREWRFIARDDRLEPFASLAYHHLIGQNVSRLEGHGGGVRYWNDILARKSPAANHGGSLATGWHQDLPNHPIDRLGGATAWIALDDVAADQGALSFLSGSHREGPLGRTYSSGVTTGGKDHLGQYPWLLDRYQLSRPVELLAGDATFHHPLTVHGAGVNTTDRNRWSYILMYTPADAVYTGATYPATDGLGLEVGRPFDHPSFPTVWPAPAPT